MAPTRSRRDTVPRRRGRPPGSRNSTTKKQVAKSTPVREKTKQKRRSWAQDASGRKGVAKARGRPRASRVQEPNDDDSEEDEISTVTPKTKKYVQLAPRTRKVPQEKIDTWPQVSSQVLERIVGVLKDAKKDIVNSQRDERKAAIAEERLESLVRVLARQLSVSRIPPQARDIHFNIDKLTERGAQLFREVTTERHTKQLLKEQEKAAQQLLEKVERNLNEVKRNAKEWRTVWKSQQSKEQLHPLLRDLDGEAIDSDGPEDIGLRGSSGVDVSAIDAPGPELVPLIDQLRRSLDSMQGNHQQVAGINPAMRSAQAALDDVFFTHASAQQYNAL